MAPNVAFFIPKKVFVIFVGVNILPENVSGKFGEIRAKIVLNPQIFLLLHLYLLTNSSFLILCCCLSHF